MKNNANKMSLEKEPNSPATTTEEKAGNKVSFSFSFNIQMHPAAVVGLVLLVGGIIGLLAVL